jgi:histone-lysine N-methyltransferase SETD8
MYFFEFKSKKYCIDATSESGRLGRLLNHSKINSNCHTKLVDIDSKPVLTILASRDIKQGEELTYDYGDRSKFTLEAHPWLLT